jgi:hypothetical protein
MARNVVRLAAAALAVTAILGFTPLGCGGSGGRFGAAGAGQGDAEIPEGVARGIRTCAAEHRFHLGRGQRSVSFDVKLASNGRVDSVALLELQKPLSRKTWVSSGFLVSGRSRVMDKDTAKQLVGQMLACIDILNEAVETANAKCSEDEARAVRRGVGYVLSEMQDRLTDPIFREYPDLVPQGVDYAPRKGPTLSEMAKKSG